MITVDRYEIRSIVTGHIRLDGGAMFGVVPKVLWAPKTDVDDANRILLATRTLIAVDRSAQRVILVDTGAGTKWTPENAQRYAIRHDGEAIDSALSGMGMNREAVTDVVVTHLHFDHNGGLTDWTNGPNGPAAPRYPNARHWIHKRHWAHAHNPTTKDRGSFIPADYACLEEAGVLQFVEGDAPPDPWPGVAWFLSHGHTPYQILPVFGEGSQKLMFVGDVIPTSIHLPLAWVMAYDVEPLVTIAEKRRILEDCRRDGLRLALPHDPQVAGVTVGGTADRPAITARLDLA